MLKYYYEHCQKEQKNTKNLDSHICSWCLSHGSFHSRTGIDGQVNGDYLEMAKNETKHSALIKTVIILGLLLFGLIIFAISKENYKKKQAQEEIDKLRQEAEKISRENSELADKLSYLESKDYQEREAKDKLNMQNPKENMVIVEPGLTPSPEPQDTGETDRKKLSVKMTNMQKWWDYFFKY